MRQGIILTVILAASIVALPCNAARGKNLIIRFHVNQKENITPSYCMAIWLEKPDGTYVKTLFASDWLAYGGYTIKGVCPGWVTKSDWANNAAELPDAISGATPRIGAMEKHFEWKKKMLPSGSYMVRIEVHSTGDFNELYSGEIELGKESYEYAATVDYLPKKHPEIAGLLSEVSIKFE
jgi:hypothetical protein